MRYKRFEDTVLVRIDKDEEILQQLQIMCEKERIVLASVEALGAIREFTVGVFDTANKKYLSNHFEGPFEITSLTGTVSTKDGAYYAHLHMSAGDSSGRVFGGHLNSAVVSATCEMVVRVIHGQVDRYFDDDIGLNLFKFD